MLGAANGLVAAVLEDGKAADEPDGQTGGAGGVDDGARLRLHRALSRERCGHVLAAVGVRIHLLVLPQKGGALTA